MDSTSFDLRKGPKPIFPLTLFASQLANPALGTGIVSPDFTSQMIDRDLAYFLLQLVMITLIPVLAFRRVAIARAGRGEDAALSLLELRRGHFGCICGKGQPFKGSLPQCNDAAASE